MKVAALDLGTNSFLCLIAEVENGRITKVLDDQVEVVRLGQEVNKTKRFHPEALARAQACLERFAKIIQSQRPVATLAMATSAARDVTNADLLFDLGKRLGIPIEIIPGGKEAEITFLGATSSLPKDGRTRLVIDVGGGSTEYIVGTDHQVQFGKSLNIGCVRLTEKFISAQPTSDQELQALSQEIAAQIQTLQRSISSFPIQEVLAVAGTPSALAAIELGGFDAKKVDGHILTKDALEQWAHQLQGLTVEEKVNDLGVERGRADVLLAGSLLLLQSLKILGHRELIVSTKGVRYGVALELAQRISARS